MKWNRNNLPYLSKSEQDEFWELWIIVNNLTGDLLWHVRLGSIVPPTPEVDWFVYRVKYLKDKSARIEREHDEQLLCQMNKASKLYDHKIEVVFSFPKVR